MQHTPGGPHGRADDASFHGEFFAKLAREELERGAVWMAEMAAKLAHQVDAKNEEYAALVTAAMQARREATGE